VALGGRGFVAVVAGCIAMSALSIDLMLPAFADMRRAFGLAPDATSISWFVTAFFLGLALGQIVYGPLSDRYGRKPMLYTGLAIYVVAGAAASFMPSLGWLVAMRVVWGLGAAAPRSLALAMVRDVFEGDRMARTMSLVMATFMMVPVVAPSLGALLLFLFPWRAVFWAPVAGATVLALCLRLLPETLPPERRRPVHPAALLEALRVVTRTRDTVAYGLVATCLFAIMTAYIGSTELIVDEVYGHDALFPFLFGAMACMLALGSVLSARLVLRTGLHQLIRKAAAYLLAIACAIGAVALAFDGRPPLWLFCVGLGLLMPAVSILTANSNTAAMLPVPHVAGMAAACLGTIATAVGALLGSVVDASYDHSVRPFCLFAAAFAAVASASVFGLASRAPAPALATTTP
jgi:DHA1 family bicyclomycin/chloramphenicol resistance-like MFS transporter